MRRKQVRRLALQRATSLPPATPQEVAQPQRPATPQPTASPPATPLAPSSPAHIAEEVQSDGSSASVATILLPQDSAEVVSAVNEPGLEEDNASDNVCVVDGIISVKRKKKSPSVLLKDADEERIAKNIENNCHFIFDKGHREYKNAEKTALAFETMAKSLQPPIKGQDLRTWFHSNRSRLGRLTLQSVQEPDRRLTQREVWIKQIFGFLEPHIVRHRKSKCVAFKNVSTFTQLN